MEKRLFIKTIIFLAVILPTICNAMKPVDNLPDFSINTYEENGILQVKFENHNPQTNLFFQLLINEYLDNSNKYTEALPINILVYTLKKFPIAPYEKIKIIINQNYIEQLTGQSQNPIADFYKKNGNIIFDFTVTTETINNTEKTAFEDPSGILWYIDTNNFLIPVFNNCRPLPSALLCQQSNHTGRRINFRTLFLLPIKVSL